MKLTTDQTNKAASILIGTAYFLLISALIVILL